MKRPRAISRPLHFFHSPAGTGDRLPLVLLHGAGGNYLQWPPHLRRLAGRDVYALDLPGHGKSVGPVCTTLAELVDAVTAWLAARGLARVVLGGHSLGGALALATALAQPGRVAGLLLVASGARLPVPADLLDMAQHDATAAAVAFVDLVYGRAAPPQVRERGTRALLALAPDVLATDLAVCAAVDLRPRLADVTVPVLALVGSDDRLTPPHLSEELAAGLSQVTYRVLAGAGHMALVETPAQVTAPMVALLDKFF